MPDPGVADARQPLPYHVAIRDYLKHEESQAWQRYASAPVRTDAVKGVRAHLSKTTHWLSPQATPSWYAAASEVAERIGLTGTVTFLQQKHPIGQSVAVADLPHEAVIIVDGPTAATLSGVELRAVIARQLGQVLLYQQWEGELWVAERALSGMAHGKDVNSPHQVSARWFELYTKIYCDRVALLAVESPVDVIATLARTESEGGAVDGASYLEQAAKAFGAGPVETNPHPRRETQLRALVLDWWHASGRDAEPKIAELVEGRPCLTGLDLTAQKRIEQATRELIDAILAPQWLQTERLLRHARSFFDDYVHRERACVARSLRQQIEQSSPSVRDYYCFVLLDFASMTRESGEGPLAHAIELAVEMGILERFVEIAARELRLRKTQIEKILANREHILAAASGEIAP